MATIDGMFPDDQPALPGVSVVLPVRNEEQHLRAAVERILAQRYDGPFEVVLAVGPSEDATARIAAELAAGRPARPTVVDNPTGRTAAGLNPAIAASRHRSSCGSTGTGAPRRLRGAAAWPCWTRPARRTSAAS